ncbi:nuclear transport factor 2 family protein [Hahella sp. HN01]|uniref:nuclear transport factor 2 family protein n=1 Tax=Hahella sp. HN01 TaxID=2847262 RepID=UPI001C1EFBBD|nr:nuclear transport factor 2 family protein [Hahella sp. HN01]MBU6951334.1 nuclear transport factor 2 family protein [Hahella sp. HN01]
MTTLDQKIAIGRQFHEALTTQNWSLLEAVLTDDATWTLPGSNEASGSGMIDGREAILDQCRLIVSYGVNFDLKHILVSRDNLALQLHNTAVNGARRLDEHLATVCVLRGDKIAAIETFLSDVPGMNAFFSKD